MNQTSLARRVLAGTAGLAAGVLSIFALAAPASAQDDAQTFGRDHQIKKVEITGEAECDTATETLTVTWSVTNKSRHNATISAVTSGGADTEVTGFAVDQLLGGDETVTGTQTFPNGTESAELTVELRWAFQVWGQWKEKRASATATVELGECKGEEPEEPEEPQPAALTDAVFFGCDLFVIALRNDQEADGATLTLTPNEDVESGHAPAFIDLIDSADGEFEVPEGFELSDVATLGAGETFTVGPLNPGEAHAHGFQPFEGLVVTATVLVGEEVIAEAELSWDGLLAEEGIECEDGGEGGELPVTGNTTLLIAGGAAVLLALGGGLFLIARRRRVTFTA